MRWPSSALVVLAACRINFDPGSTTSDAGTPDSVIPAEPPRVFSSPSPAASTYPGYPNALTVTLATDDPEARIYYTTDGSVPTLASQGGPTPVGGISIATTTTLRYFAENSAGSSPQSSEMFVVSTSAQSEGGYIVTGTKLDGASPVVIAMPGQVLNAMADVQVWVQSTCPLCQAQLVYGVGTSDQGCLVDARTGVYPGVTTTKAFTVRAPTTPGLHEVRVAHIEFLNCAEAMAANALLTRPTVSRIGVIFVR